MQELDKSLLTQDKSSEIYNCCDEHNKAKGYLCFEDLGGFDIQTPKAAMHFCLPTRAIVESSHNSCQNNEQCFMLNDLCVKPALDNVTKVSEILNNESFDSLRDQSFGIPFLHIYSYLYCRLFKFRDMDVRMCYFLAIHRKSIILQNWLIGCRDFHF